MKSNNSNPAMISPPGDAKITSISHLGFSLDHSVSLVMHFVTDSLLTSPENLYKKFSSSVAFSRSLFLTAALNLRESCQSLCLVLF
jgi:hypothetical protein